MKKIILTIFLLIILIFLFSIVFNQKNISKENNTAQACFKKHCFNLEIAETQEQKRKGLMFKTKLDPTSGMIFVYESLGIHNFWMKNTLIPLDIIWLDENNKVVFIKNNAPPCPLDVLKCLSFGPNILSKNVLELNGGTVDKIGLKVGDIVEISY